MVTTSTTTKVNMGKFWTTVSRGIFSRHFFFGVFRRNFSEGDSVSITTAFSNEDVQVFSKLSGDYNPLHLDEDYARRRDLQRCIVHGALLNGLVSGLLGTKLPGPGCVVTKQTLEFPKPLYVNEPVTATVTVTSFRKSIVVCNFDCTTIDGKRVLQGDVQLFLMRDKPFQDGA